MQCDFRPESIRSRRTKIVCTLGPSTSSDDRLASLIEAGMDVARFNFSHGSRDEHAARLEQVRRAVRGTKANLALLQDLPGPKIRVGRFRGGKALLLTASTFVLTVLDVEGDAGIASVSSSLLPPEVAPGETVLLDDGNIVLKVEEIKGAEVHCRVVHGGMLSDFKGVNLPDTELSTQTPTEADLEHLGFGLEHGFDCVALSFVRSAGEVRTLKKEIAARGMDLPVIVKIEKPQAVREIDSITDAADGIMIARGDLGVEMSAEEVPPIQKKVIAICNRKGVPVITATQMLESMVRNPRPTRAEASDVANAVLDGSDAVMLSAETAIGDFPVEAVRVLHRVIALIEANGGDLQSRSRAPVTSADQAIAKAACETAEITDAKMIVCLTQSGSTAARISRFRPSKPIVAFTPDPDVLRRLALYWGVSPFRLDELGHDFDGAVYDILATMKSTGGVARGDRVVFTAGLPFHKRGLTNMIRVETV
jgi:pyruvate kinase